MFLYSGFEMFLITVLTPQPEGFIITKTLYLPMTFASVLGMLLFTLYLSEKKEEARKNDDTTKISDNSEINALNEKIIRISHELEEYKTKIDNLERELNDIKGKCD